MSEHEIDRAREIEESWDNETRAPAAFHDEADHDFELQAYESTKALVLWLQTTAPVSGRQSQAMATGLLQLAQEMGWPTYTCPDTGLRLIGEISGVGQKVLPD